MTEYDNTSLIIAKLGKKRPPRSAEWCRKIYLHKKAYWAKRKAHG